jgi:hypothetical protein
VIPKVVRSRDGKGSGGRGFKGAIAYVTGKAEAVALRNLEDLRTAAGEMRAVANESRLDKPVYHFVLSWAELERPTDDQAIAAADRALESLGLDSHQAVIAVHRDRDHHHVHVVVNKRGLDGRTANLSQDFARLEKACREVEYQQGWAQDRGHFAPEIGSDGTVSLTHQPRRSEKRAAIDRERRTGREPLSAFLGRDEIHDQLAAHIDGAGSWAQLQAGLSSLGLRYEAAGSGARLISLTDSTDTASPSHIDKAWARSRLEQRLGPMPMASAPKSEKGNHNGHHASAVGRYPPPAARNRLRTLSELDVVRFPRRGEVLLPGDVPGHLVDAGTQPDRPLRRPRDPVAPAQGIRQASARTPYQEARERLWQAFQQHKQANYDQLTQQRRLAREALYRRHQAEREQLVASQRHRRKTLDILFGRRGVARWVFRQWDGRRSSAEWTDLKQRHLSERKALRAAKAQPPEWRSFLDEQARAGNHDAQLVARLTKLARSADMRQAAGYGNSEAELAAMRRIDLVKLASNMGYTVDPRESTRASVKMRKGADVVIAQPEQDGSWSYFNTGNENDHGGVIQFVQHRQGGSLGHVRQFLRSYLDGQYAAQPSAPLEQDHDHTAARQAWAAAEVAFPTYLQQRGIDRTTVQALARDQVRQDLRGNVLFAHRDQAGNVVGFEVKGRTWSGFAKGGQKTLAIFGTAEARQQAARIIVVESGIDALSLGQMEHRRDTLYVSTGGAVGRRTLDELRRLVERHPQAAVALGFDNDEAGRNLTERVDNSLNQAPKHLRPRAKDWNEDLQALRQQQTRERRRSHGVQM